MKIRDLKTIIVGKQCGLPLYQLLGKTGVAE